MRRPAGVVCRRRRTIPRAHLLADVASENMIADGAAMFRWNRSAIFDGEVRNALGRVEHMRLDKRAGRARLDAQRAGSALIERRSIGFERKAADNFRQQEPRPRVLINDAGVLADPSEACILRVYPLLHRAGVDVCACVERLGVLRAHPLEERLHAFGEHLVIIVARRIARDFRGGLVIPLCGIRAGGVVDRAHHDHRLRCRHDTPHVGAALGGSRQIRHGAGVSAIDPLSKEG